MIALTSRERSLALFFSACAYVAWFSGIDDRLEARDIDRKPMALVSLVSQRPRPPVGAVIVRDPFSGAPDRVARAEFGDGSAIRIDGQTPTGVELGALSDGAHFPSGSVVRATAPGDPPSPLVVRATITGPHPVAYVADGSTMEIVRIGDRLGERRVAQIDLHGLTFSDGTQLDLPGAFAATPAPAVETPPVALQLDRLSRLLRDVAAARPRGTSTSVPSPAPSVAPTNAYPTPGPLPTVNRRGVPVGTNPTFDPTASTPYPEPYPYAPPARRP